jgi:hypothetical protein
MKTIIDRIREFIENNNISIRQFEISIGASNGLISNAIKKGTDIQSKWISKIIEIYKINPIWILTGEGEMLRAAGQGQPPHKMAQKEEPKPPGCPLCAEKDKIINQLEKMIDILNNCLTEADKNAEVYRNLLNSMPPAEYINKQAS